MFEYLQRTSINVCADIESPMAEAFFERKPVVFHAGNQSMINNEPIEKISHHVWLSNHVDNGKSKEINDRHFESLLKQYDKMD